MPQDLFMVENLWRSMRFSYPEEVTIFLVQNDLKLCHRFLKVSMVTSNFTNEAYNGGFVQEISVSMLNERNHRASLKL